MVEEDSRGIQTHRLLVLVVLQVLVLRYRGLHKSLISINLDLREL